MPIQSFGSRDTEELFKDGKSRRWSGIAQVALRKLDMLNAAVELADLSSPPGNRLKPLSGNREGQYSIRINDQFRLCFVWTAAGPKAIEITDYH